jgi:hypothetical protein
MAKNKRPPRKPQSPKPQSFADLQRQIREEGRRHERLRWPLSPEDVERLKGPELPPHIVAEQELRSAEQRWREWQEQAQKARGAGWREDPDLALSARHWREHLGQLRGMLDYYLREHAAQKALVAPQSRTPKERHGGGNRRILTNDEIVRLRAAYPAAQAAAQAKGRTKQDDIFDELRKVLPKEKRSKSYISNRSLRRYLSS